MWVWLCSEYEKGVYLNSAITNLTKNVQQYYAPWTKPFVDTFLGGVNTGVQAWGWQSVFGNGSGTYNIIAGWNTGRRLHFWH
jgi:hypothetical protein